MTGHTGRLAWWVSVAVGGVLAPGCQMPPASQPARLSPAAQEVANAPLEPNIIAVIARYGLDPFGRMGGSPRTNAFAISALYLIASTPEGNKGVFGDGIIHVYMYVLEKDQAGRPARRLAREWTFTPEQAMPFRVKKKTVLGHAYRLHCSWGEEDYLGKRIEIEVTFERRDGRVVRSTPHVATVPAS